MFASTHKPVSLFVSKISATPPVEIPTVRPSFKYFVADGAEASITPIQPRKCLNTGVLKTTELAKPLNEKPTTDGNEITAHKLPYGKTPLLYMWKK